MTIRLALASLLVVGCSPVSKESYPPVVSQSPAMGTAPAAPPSSSLSLGFAPAPRFAGRTYSITAIDGQAPASMATDEGERRTPRFGFVERSYGGTSGCNGMGGLYAQVGDRLFTMPGPQTQMGCGGRLGEQERVIGAVLKASPTIARSGDVIELRGAGHVLRIVQDAAADTMGEVPTAWQGDGLAGQSFVVWTVNGARSERTARDGWPTAKLHFNADRMTARIDCPAPMVAPFRQSGRRLEASDVAASCPAPRDTGFAAILAASPTLVSGPNGELLIASPAGWITAENERRDRPK